MFMKRVEKLLDCMPVSSYSEACKPIKEPTYSQPMLPGALSEFALHNQVLQNTWGRIEFEIEGQPIQRLLECNEIIEGKKEKGPAKSEYDCRLRVKTRYRMAVPEQFKERTAKQALTDDSLREHPRHDSGIATVRFSLAQRIEAAKAQTRKEFRCRESRRTLTLIAERKANAAMAIEKNVFINFSLSVLSTLARSQQTPQSALKWLAFHESAAIRKSVAKNLSTDLDVLEILAHDEDENVRLAVAENPQVTKEFLLRLLNDDASMIADKAKSVLHNMARDQANESPPEIILNMS